MSCGLSAINCRGWSGNGDSIASTHFPFVLTAQTPRISPPVRGWCVILRRFVCTARSLEHVAQPRLCWCLMPCRSHSVPNLAPQAYTMSLTLYAFQADFRRFKAEIAATYNGVTLTTPKFVAGQDDATPEFIAMNPLGKVPVLQTAEGVIFESNAIARYVAGLRRDSELLGASYYESGLVDSWLDFCSNEIELPACLWVYPVLGLAEYDADLFAQAKTDLFAGLATLESHLLLNTYLVGNAITLADIVMASALLYPFKFVLDGNCRKRFPSVVRWFTTLVNQPEFVKSMGEVTLCQQQIQPAGAAKGGKKGGKKGQQKGQQKKAAPKKKAAKKKAVAPPPAPKKELGPVDKLKKLPRSKFSMMAWLKEYMGHNEDKSFAQAMPWFFENFDSEGWSVWFMKYKFGEANKTDFFAGNQMSGFFQRGSEMVKPNLLFGQVLAYNSGSYFDIEGAVIIRGTSLEPLLESNASAGSYDFEAYDNSNEEHRARLTALWCTQYGQQFKGFEVDDTRDSVTCH